MDVNACKMVGIIKSYFLNALHLSPNGIDELKTFQIWLKHLLQLLDFQIIPFAVPLLSPQFALGAKVIEKHFIRDKELGGSDSKFQ
jgi:hypothetical protein